MSSDKSELPSRRKLLVATAIAVATALLVVVLFVMPAEYGIDPTGVGKLLGLDRFDASSDSPGLNDTNVTTVPILHYDVTFPKTTTARPAVAGASDVGVPVEVPVDVFAPNLVNLTAVLEWTDGDASGQPSPDTFEVQWRDPDGALYPANQARNDESGAGAAVTVALIDAPPERGFVEATTSDDAVADMKEAYPTSFRGNGQWTLIVTLVEAPGLGGVAPDGANDWTLFVSTEAYNPALGPASETGRFRDTLDFTVPGQGKIEFKLYLAEGAVLTYEWTASREINFDFHGDHGDNSANITRHESGTVDGRAEEFEAPFTGRHGWYWQTTDNQEVEIRLVLEGDYRIIGVV